MYKLLISVILLSWFQTVIAHEHDGHKGFDIKVADLGDGIFQLRTDRSGNVAVLIGDDGVLMVDTKMEHLISLIDSEQKKLSNNRDVDLVINTHFHRDHVRGNAYFKERGAIIMAHTNVRQYMENPVALRALGREAPRFTPQYFPTIDLKADATIAMNGQTIELYHPSNAHTNSDLFIRFQEANVIHAGDLVSTQRFPFIDIDNGGSVKGLIAALRAIIDLANEDTKIIAGHGPVASRIDLLASIKMLEESYKVIDNLVQQGFSLDEIKALDPLNKFEEKWSWEFITAQRMTTILYYDIAGRLE
ncbi:MAG: MBL fold metallo-hydrolase [Gammaproteobacteria bacterium]|nr:MBL fold metallo-hydrolase [Gammaproteobacteria bacterium]